MSEQQYNWVCPWMRIETKDLRSLTPEYQPAPVARSTTPKEDKADE